MSHVAKHDIYRMTSPLHTRDGKNGAESHTLYPNYVFYDDASVTPIDPYVDALGSTYTSPTSKNASKNSLSLQSNTCSTEAAAECLGLHFPGAIYSPPTVPFAASFHGIEPIASNGWQAEVGSSTAESPGMQWWHAPWIDSGSNNYSTASPRLVGAGASSTHNQKSDSTSFSNATTSESQHQHRTDSLQPSLTSRKKTCGNTEPCQVTNFESKVSRRMIAPTYTTNSPETFSPLTSDVKLKLPNTTAHPNPRQPESSRRASSRVGTQRTIQPLPATSRPDQRARNRTAAIKCRIKTKAAVAELEATEKAESSRHEVLLTTLRGLQADVFALKSEVLLHGNCGDELIQDYLNNTARSLTTR